MKVRDLRRNSGECQGNSCEYGLWVRQFDVPQKRIDHFFLFRSPFRNHFVTFHVFGHLFAYSLLPPLFAAG